MSTKEAYAKYNELIKDGSTHIAERYAKRVYDNLKSKKTTSKSRTAATKNYGSILLINRKEEDALPILEESLTLYISQYGENAEELLDPLMDLGHANVKYMGKSKGKKYYDQALEIAMLGHGQQSELYAGLLFEIAQQRLINGVTPRDRKKSLKQLKESHKIYAAVVGNDHYLTARTSYRIGEIYKVTGKKESAASYLESAAASFDKHMPNSMLAQKSHTMLVSILEDIGRTDDATEHCQAVGRIKAANKEEYDPNDITPLKIIRPRYPRSAQVRGIQGTATISLTVTSEGRTSDIKILNSKGHKDFGKESVKAAKKFRYAARSVNGEPVDTKDVLYLFRYNLSN